MNMKIVEYPARIFPDPEDTEGRWLVHFRGLGGGDVGIWTEGDDREHARTMARECLSAYLMDGPMEAPFEPEEGEEMISPDLPVGLALVIRDMRGSAGLSQTEAARRIGVAQSTYHRWEDPSRCNATVETIEKIARAFGRRVEISFPEAS